MARTKDSHDASNDAPVPKFTRKPRGATKAQLAHRV